MKWWSYCFESSDQLVIPAYLWDVVWIQSVTFYLLRYIQSLIILFVPHFLEVYLLLHVESEGIKVESWIIPFLFSKTRLSGWLCNFPSISSSLQLLIILILNNQTVVLFGMYPVTPRNFLKEILSIPCFSSSKSKSI